MPERDKKKKKSHKRSVGHIQLESKRKKKKEYESFQQRTERTPKLQTVNYDAANASQMNETSRHDGQMHNLMTSTPTVIRAGATTFGKAHDVNDGAKKVDHYGA